MASSSFSRFLVTSKQTLTVLSRSYTSLASSSTSLSKASILRYRPIVAVAAHLNRISPVTSTRSFAVRPASSSLNDPNPNWSNRPPKETILLDGCDFEHWLVVMEKPNGDMTRDDIIAHYIKTLAEVVGSEEEARMKIYSVSTRHYFAFGALVSEELSYKLKDIPGVRWVLPDSYLDVKNKDYGGEPFINGQAVPYDPKYHEEWVRNNARAGERNRRQDRPRNFDRSRNFERRRENVQNAGPNAGPPNPQGGPPRNMQQNPGQVPQGNVGGGPSPYTQSGPPGPGGYAPNQNFQPPPPGAGGYQPNNQHFQPGPGGYTQNNQNFQPGPPGPGGYPQNNQNFQSGGRSSYGGGPNYPAPGGPPNPGYQNQGGGQGPSADYQGGGYPPNNAGGNPYQNQNQNIPGRDVPPPNYR